MIFLLFLLSSCSGSPEADPKASILSHGYDAVPYCANGGYCVAPVACAPWYLATLYDSSASCYLAPGTPGVCCPVAKPACKYRDTLLILSLKK